MNLDKLIKELQSIQEEHGGDLKVATVECGRSPNPPTFKIKKDSNLLSIDLNPFD